MAFRTFGDLKTQIQKELDLEEEEFISPSEMIGYFNRAVSVAESHIITLGLRDKYFLARAKVNSVQGEEEIDLPANLYANKILKIIYRRGATFYTVRPLDSKDMFENYEYLNEYASTDFYRYMILHNSAGDEKLILVPRARESATDVMTIWYFRDANRYVNDADLCDLPEIAYEYISAYVKEMSYAKESHVNYEGAKQDRMEKESLMQSVLAGQIQDNEMSKLELDLSSYQESS
jgi:hypothetical protein